MRICFSLLYAPQNIQLIQLTFTSSLSISVLFQNLLISCHLLLCILFLYLIAESWKNPSFAKMLWT